jgi:glycosyltransferase involved in cell wall biosynthesis
MKARPDTPVQAAPTLERALEEDSDSEGYSRPATRLLVIASHPIQYQAPFFKAVAATDDIDVMVAFCSDAGAREYHDDGFGVRLKWDRPLTEGYQHVFLSNASPRPSIKGFFGLINLGVMRLINRSRFDAIMIHGWVDATTWLAAGTAVLRGVPIVIRAETATRLPRTGVKEWVRTHALGWLFRQIRAFLAIGTRGMQMYKASGVPEDRIAIAPYAVDNAYFFAEADRLRESRTMLLEELGLSPGLPLIVYAGKLIPRKRPLDLVNAVARMSTAASLVLVGDGELRREIEQAIHEQELTNVRITGFVNQREITRYYAAASAFVLPSEFETWGLVLNEAMCFGIPVIASAGCGAADDLVRQGENGMVYPVGDVDALADALDAVLDPSTNARMGKASQRIISEWSYEVGIHALRRVLRRLSRQGARST